MRETRNNNLPNAAGFAGWEVSKRVFRIPKYRNISGQQQHSCHPGGVSIWANLSPPRHADMLLVSIFQLFYKDPDLKHVGMTREDETAALPSS
jgi:hypothetical protein